MRKHCPPCVVLPIDPGERSLVETETVIAEMLQCLRVEDLHRTGFRLMRIIRVRTVQLAVEHDAGIQVRQRILFARFPQCDAFARLLVVLADRRVSDRIEILNVTRGGYMQRTPSDS